MRKLGFIKKSGFIIGVIVLLMAVMPMSDGLPVQAQDWLEYGDAPDFPPFGTYPSLLASNGARHVFTETEILGLGGMGDWKNTEPDANVPDADPLDDGLVPAGGPWFIAAGNPVAFVTFEVTDFVQGLPPLWVNILIDLNGDGDWSDNIGGQSEHVVVNQAMPPGPFELTFPSSTFSTVGATPGVTYLRLTLTRTPIGAGWDGTVLWPFDYGETEDYEITIESSGDLPDLVVAEKWEIVEGCLYWVGYMVYNNGNAPAGASTTCIYADDTLVTTAPCPPLPAGGSNTTTVGPYECPGNTTVWIEVCADNYNVVAESDEENNCKENLMEQPLEFGDAPDPTYPSLLASDGSRHCPTDTEILGLGLSLGEWKDFELDARVIDKDIPYSDGLVTPFIVANNPAATVAFEVTNFIATDNLIVNILIDLNIDGDWIDAGEHVVQNQAIPLPGPAENTFVSDSFNTMGAITGPTWLRLTLTRTPVTAPWDGTGLFDCGETEDWNITIEEEEPEEWYYKPNQTDYAPSGMPDFDQKQDMWQNPPGGPWSYCGPVAVANSLWWFDSREETGGIPPPTISDSYGLVTNYSQPWDDHNASNVQWLVNDLAWYMDTDGQRTGIPHNGTNVFDMQQGIRDYLNATGYNDSYYEHTEPWPNFYWIEGEVERCQDVILLLGFYHNDTGYYERIGGHYVTCAGVNSPGMQIGISDPFFDNKEAGGPGRIPVPHPAHPGNGTVHNDAQYVSHDTYNVAQVFPGPIPPMPPTGCWALQNYPVGTTPPGVNITNFIKQNGGPGWYNPGAPVEVIIEYAVAVSPIVVNATLVGNVTFVGRGGAPDAKWIESFVVKGFEAGNLSNELWSENATTNNTGFFTIPNLAPGTYDIGIKNRTSLSELETGETLNPGINYVDFGEIREGDIIESDKVDGFDVSKLGMAYGAKPGDGNWDPNADLNRSGKVDGFDVSLIGMYYGKLGEAKGYF